MSSRRAPCSGSSAGRRPVDLSESDTISTHLVHPPGIDALARWGLRDRLVAVHGNQDATDGFCQVNAGVISPAAFFAPENVGQIFAAAGARG